MFKRIRRRNLVLLVTIISLFMLVGCSSDSGSDATDNGSTLQVAVNVPQSGEVSSKSLEITLQSIEVTIINQNDSSDTQTKTVDIDSDDTEVAFEFAGLEDGATYDVTVNAKDSDDYDVYTGEAVAVINGLSTVSVSMEYNEVENLIFNLNNIPEDSASGVVTILPTDLALEAEINVTEGIAEFGQISANEYAAVITLYDGSDNELLSKTIESFEALPGRVVNISVDLEDGSTTVIDEEKIIESLEIELTQASIEVGESCTLPVTAIATMSDDTTKEVDLTWEDLDGSIVENGVVDTSEAGTYEFTGGADGTDETVTFQLEVEDEDAWKNNTGTINLGNEITYTGEGISVSGTTIYITEGGDHTVTGTLSDGMIYVDTTERVKLRLTNASITNLDGPAIYGQNTDKLFITLDEGSVNTLSDGSSYSDEEAKATLFCNDDLEIKGRGTLNITGNYKHAIASDDDVIIERGNINVISAVSDGIHANGSIEVKDGTLNITASKDALQTEDEEVLIEAGTLELSAGSQGLTSDTAVTINGGTIDVVKSKEGIESQLITINDGYLYIEADDDAVNSTMGSAVEQDDGSEFIVNGGYIYLSALNGDGLDSNGSATMTGGTLAIHGSSMEPGIDVNGTTTVSGGMLIMAGSNSNMSEYPTGESDQYSIATMLSEPISAGSPFCIKDSSGNVLVIFKPERDSYSVVFSSPELKQGETYTIYTGGTVSGGTETKGLITDGTYSGGTEATSITITTSPTTASNWNGGGGGGFPPGGGFVGW